MTAQTPERSAGYVLGFDGGGTKTECVLADTDGKVFARATAGPSNPVRAGYMRTWFALGEAADAVMARYKISANQITAVCAGIGGAGRAGVSLRIETYFKRSFPAAEVRVTTDLDIAHEAAFAGGEGMLLLCGTGSAAFGRGSGGRTARAGGHGPWISDEGSAFDIGREAVKALSLATEHRGPETALAKKIFAPNAWRDWELLSEAITKHADDVFPKIFPMVAQLADRDDAVCQAILADAAKALSGLALAAAKELGWESREFLIAKAGGAYGRSKFFDSAVEAEVAKVLPGARLVSMEKSAAEAAVRIAARQAQGKGNAA